MRKWQDVILDNTVMGGPLEEMTFEQRPEHSQEWPYNLSGENTLQADETVSMSFDMNLDHSR